MEKFTINYSQKNIPIPSKCQYILSLISNVDKNKNMHSFKLLKYPPSLNEMKNFVNELRWTVKNIEFKNVKNEFWEKLKEDINEIKTSDKIFVAPDKARHL